MGVLKAAIGASLVSAATYCGIDATNDLIAFRILRSLALDIASSNESLQTQLGDPVTVAPWYDCSIRFSHEGHIANAVFTLHGAKQSTDIAVKAVRRTFPVPSMFGTLLYNTLGPAEWQLLSCSALGEGRAGLTNSINLLPAPPAQADGAVQAKST